MSKKKKIIIATGGTGGHIFPARSLAQALAKDDFDVTIFSDKNYKKYVQKGDIFKFKIIASSQLKRSVSALLNAVFLISFGILKTFFLILLKKPEVIIAFGGYATFPTLISAVILRRKIILHEQNSHFGKVNRIFARFAKIIATSFEETDAILKEFKNKTKYVGNPVREEILKLNKKRYKYPNFNLEYKSKNNLGYNLVLASDFEEIKKIKEEYFNILVIGGSGGAKIFSDILPKAFFNLRDEIKNKINIVQQCRSDLLEETFNQYKHFNLNITIRGFFRDIEKQIENAHLIIARSGSSSIAEFSVAKKPMILIPFAKSADNHQEKNANYVQESGGAVVIKENDFSIQNLTQLIEKLIDNPEILKRMSKDVAKIANLKATENLVKLVKNL